MNDSIAFADRLPSLESQSVRVLEEFLNDRNLPPEQRANLAIQILALRQQGEPIGSTSTQPSPTELSQSWRDWVAENKQSGVPDANLIDDMIRNGIDIRDAIDAVKEIRVNPQERLASLPEFQTLKKIESLVNIQRQLSQLSPRSTSIERRGKLSDEEFFLEYYTTNTPVILTEMMADWPAMQQWSPEFFKAKYGEAMVQVQTERNSNANYEIDTEKHRQTVPFKEYIDRVVTGGDTNDYYMVANNQTLEREEFKNLFDDIKMPGFLNPETTKQNVFFWFGPGGTITPLHHDLMNIVMAQIYGRKRWRLIDPKYTDSIYNHIGVFSKIDLENPDLEKYPLCKDVPVMEVVVEPGEIIFVPVGWWHQVKGLDVSISMSFTNFTFPNQFQFNNPDINYN